MKSSENGSVPGVVIKTRLQLGAKLGQKVTQEHFAELVIEGLINVSVSRGSVVAWENGKYDPPTDLLLILIARYHGTNDWRRTFAMECLKAKLPEVFDSGVIVLPLVN